MAAPGRRAGPLHADIHESIAAITFPPSEHERRGDVNAHHLIVDWARYYYRLCRSHT